MGYYASPAGPIFFAGALTNGVGQVETVNVVGTITLAGNATVTVTAAGMAGSPIAVSVAVALNDTATIVATKIAAAMNANAVIAGFFSITSNVADVIFTRLTSAANDATMNIAYANDTCTGLTNDATSADTTAGVLGDFRGLDSGAFIIDLTAKTVKKNTGTPGIPIWTVQ